MNRPRPLRRFRRDDSGGALVEFALLLPSLLLFCVISVEAGRTFWSYQTTISGVRDATRYLSRVADRDVCTSGGSLDQWEGRLTRIVAETQAGDSIFPDTITVASVRPTLACTSGGFRGTTAAVVTVTATLAIEYPFQRLIAFAGGAIDTVTTTVSDSARVVQR